MIRNFAGQGAIVMLLADVYLFLNALLPPAGVALAQGQPGISAKPTIKLQSDSIEPRPSSLQRPGRGECRLESELGLVGCPVLD
jgi:hypothetical protein